MTDNLDIPHAYLVYDNRTVTARIEHKGKISSFKRVFRDYENLEPHDFCSKVADEIESFMGRDITWSMVERNAPTDDEARRVAEIRKQARKNERRAQKQAEWEESQRIKAAATLKAAHMNIDELTSDEINRFNASDIYDVYTKMIGSGLHTFGGLLIGGERSDAAFQLEATKALISQNWILIRQNEQIIRELKKLNGKNQQE